MPRTDEPHLPQFAATHNSWRNCLNVTAPRATASRICRSVTALQMQIYIAREGLAIRIILIYILAIVNGVERAMFFPFATASC
jgi:hypothetical protein